MRNAISRNNDKTLLRFVQIDQNEHAKDDVAKVISYSEGQSRIERESETLDRKYRDFVSFYFIFCMQ